MCGPIVCTADAGASSTAHGSVDVDGFSAYVDDGTAAWVGSRATATAWKDGVAAAVEVVDVGIRGRLGKVGHRLGLDTLKILKKEVV